MALYVKILPTDNILWVPHNRTLNRLNERKNHAERTAKWANIFYKSFYF